MHCFAPSRLLYILALTVVTILSGCKTSNDVVSNGWIQKRKHRSGFHLNIAKKQKHEIPSREIESAIAQRDFPKQPIEVESKELGKDTRTLKHSRQGNSRWKSNLFHRRIASQKTIDNKRRPMPPLAKIEEEASVDEDHIEKNKRKLIWSSATGGIAFFLGIILYVISRFLLLSTGGTLGAILGLFAPFLLAIGLLALTVALFYLIEFFLNKNDRTMFTEKFRKVMGIISLVSAIILGLYWILGGAGMALILALLIPAAIEDIFTLLVALALFTYLSIFVVGFFGWISSVATYFSFQFTKAAKAALIIQVSSPVVGILLAILLLLILL